MSHNGTRSLLNSLLKTRELSAELWQALVSCVGGNPLFATEYARMVSDPLMPCVHNDGGLPTPSSVRSVITAQLDALLFPVKAVLGDAAVVGDVVSPGAVAATGQRDPGDVAKALELLEQRDFCAVRAATARPARSSTGSGTHWSATSWPTSCRARTAGRADPWNTAKAASPDAGEAAFDR